MPYREAGDPNAGVSETTAKALEKMEKEIAAEDKVSIQLPEYFRAGDPIPLFADTLNGNTDPKDIVFYSKKTGILKYQDQIYNSYRQSKVYTYIDKENSGHLLLACNGETAEIVTYYPPGAID